MSVVTTRGGTTQFPFQSVSLLKKHPSLGHGAYGVVYEAICDELHCVAKCFHSRIFTRNTHGACEARHDQPHAGHEEAFDMAQLRRDLQSVCGLNHPNLVQYLGTYYEPLASNPVLLMEKMDTNLSDFLRNHQNTRLPITLEVGICHDIALGLHFLHKNGIRHYNLSSNNVLLLGTLRAKVSDFGLAKLYGTSYARASIDSWPYLAPEMHLNVLKASEKSDVFSLGVCMIQVLTRQPPAPTSLMEEITSHKATETFKVVPEEIRRCNDIALVDDTHPMLSIALDSIKNDQQSRPSTKILCSTLKQLRNSEDCQHNEMVKAKPRLSSDYLVIEFDEPSKQRMQDRIAHQKCQLEDKERRLDQMQQLLSLKEQLLRTKDQELASKETEIDRLSIDLVGAEKQALKGRSIESKNDTSNNQKLAEKEQRIFELEAQVATLQQSSTPSPSTPKGFAFASGSGSPRTNSQKFTYSHRLSFTWKKGKVGPVPFRPQSSVVVGHNGNVFISHCDIERASGQVYEYDLSADAWQALPTVLKSQFTIVIFQEVLVAVGGSRNLRKVNTLHAYSKTCLPNDKQVRWVDDFYPNMPTARAFPSCASHGHYLLVAGGEVQGMAVTEVDVFDIRKKRWEMVRRLPQFGLYTKMTTGTLGDNGFTYFLGGFEEDKTLTNIAYRCLVPNLVKYSRDREQVLWEMLSPLPVAGATCVVLRDQLLAFGGYDRKTAKVSNAIYSYRPPPLDKWERLNATLPCSFSRGLVAVTYSNDKPVVVLLGGFAESGTCFTYSAIL